MGDIIERLRFDAARCELQFSKGVAGNIDEAADEIERLREAITMAANRLEVAVVCTEDGGRDVCEHCIDLALSYLKIDVTSDTPKTEDKTDQQVKSK